MGLTLLEASKINSGEVKRAAVIEMFAANSDLLRAMNWETVLGGSLQYTVEGSLPGVAFRGYNETYTPSTGVVNPEVEVLKIVGGNLDVDRAIIKTRGPEVRASQEEMKVKAMSLHVADKIINGDSESNPREFDGLRKRIVGSQLIPANLGAPSANSPLSLEALDKAIDEVDGATHLIMSPDMRRKLIKAARAGVGGDIQVDTDSFGFRVTRYNDLPILIADYNDLGQAIVDFDEAGPAGGTTATSIYVVHIGDGYVTGLQNGVMEVEDLGLLDDGIYYRTRVEWIAGMAVMHGRACARVWGITNADVTA
ncbi:MAG: major capsid protein [Hyphomicrobiaceae bacterium]